MKDRIIDYTVYGLMLLMIYAFCGGARLVVREQNLFKRCDTIKNNQPQYDACARNAMADAKKM